MKITLVCVGRLKEPWYRDACAEYLKRLAPYATVNVAEVADRDVTRDEVRALREEGADILRAIPDGARVVLLTPQGTMRDSVEFSKHLAELALRGSSSLAFVVGGAAGVAPEVIARADEKMSLGPMTLPHQLARVVLVEQLYRAFRIERGEPYHR